jgi:glycogen debranching enzyme
MTLDLSDPDKISDRSELNPHRLTLNYGDTFAIFDHLGDIRNIVERSQGLFFKGCRYLSGSELRIFGRRPELLCSTVREETDILSADLTNPEVVTSSQKIDRGSLHINRLKFLKSGRCFEQLLIENFSMQNLTVPISLSFKSDFHDLFELRGFNRKAPRGKISEKAKSDRIFEATYDGLDGIERCLLIELPEGWRAQGEGVFKYEIDLGPGEHRDFEISFNLTLGSACCATGTLPESLEVLQEELLTEKKKIADITTPNNLFNHWVTRSKLDLITLLSDVGQHQYPFAGVPWYNTVFGRDGIITSIQCLLFAPQVARNVLLYLAEHQADSMDANSDAEPGKILHEVREGELVNIGEVPFKHYYGSVDSTPLFLWLAGLYYQRTGDLELMKTLWPNFERALEWIDHYGDIDGDGFVEYKRRSENGLRNQGWKDSHDSISHADGTLAEGPISLCEVQGYVYQAKLSIAKIARGLKKPELAERLDQQAEKLKKNFNKAFWDEENQYVVLALDGMKRPVRVTTSNPGHCLATQIIDSSHVNAVATRLMQDDLYSGWGIRTLSEKEKRYNPMSYHNGSVWPHDTSIAAFGLALHGHTDSAAKVCESLFEASMFFEMRRMPELFCGFNRRNNEGPILYPVACSPQAWAVASVYLIVSSLFGIEIFAQDKSIRMMRPAMPRFLDELTIERIPIDGGCLSLRFIRYGNDIGIEILEKPQDWTLMICK